MIKATKFILFTTQRSGSTFIFRLLNTHPEIAMYGEVFLPESWLGGFQRYCTTENNYSLIYLMYKIRILRKINKYIPLQTSLDRITKSYLDKFFMRNKEYINKNHEHDSTGNIEDCILKSNPKALGFKIMVNQSRELPSIVEWINDNKPKIIILKRRILDKYISTLAVKKRGGLPHSVKYANDIELNINLNDFEDYYKKSIYEFNYLDKFKKNFKFIELDYDSFFSNIDLYTKRIIDFIGVDSTLPVVLPIMKKLNRQKKQDMIINFEEVQSFYGELQNRYEVNMTL